MGAKILVRILAGCFCLTVILIFLLDFQIARKVWINDYFNLLALIIIFPVFAITAILGTIPKFFLRHFSKEFLDDISDADQYFTKFNIKSISFALVALSMMFFYVFKNNFL